MASLIDRRKMMQGISLSKYLSSSAIADLRLAFPANWSDIIYGFNQYIESIGVNGEIIVTLANEDPMILCSLVNTGKTRGVTFSNSYADFNIMPTPYTTTKFQFQIKYIDNNDWFGANSSLNGGGGNGFIRSCGITTPTQIDFTKWYSLELFYNYNSNIRYFSVDGTQYSGSSYATANPFVLGALGGAVSNKGHYSVTGLKCFCGGALIAEYLPFIRSGNVELIDIRTGNLATRNGTFIEFIE